MTGIIYIVLLAILALVTLYFVLMYVRRRGTGDVGSATVGARRGLDDRRAAVAGLPPTRGWG